VTEDRTPQQALDDIRQARQQVFNRMQSWPWWYDAGYGAACGIMVAGPAFSTPISLLCTAVGLVILGVIVRKWTDLTGVWVNGYKPRRARWVAFGLAAVFVAMVLTSLYLGRQLGLVWAGPLLGLAAGVLAVVCSRIWTRVYLAETRELP